MTKQIKMFFQYMRYLAIHKWYVGCACFKMGLYRQGIVHDWSKFLPSEFEAYKNYFYDNKDLYEDNFTLAWMKHIHRNPHHRQYRIVRYDDGGTKALEIPDKYLKEMLCDWWGAGRTFATTPEKIELYKYAYRHEVYNWFEKRKHSMMLETRTLQKIVEFLEAQKKIDLIENHDSPEMFAKAYPA